MKKLLTVLILVAVLGGMGFMLVKNKRTIDEKSQPKTGNRFIPVTVVPASPKNLSENLTMMGTFEPYKELKLVSEVQGKVTRVGVEEGDFVQPGTLIAQVDNDLIRAEIVAAEAAFEQAKKTAARFEALRQGEATTDAQVEDTRLAVKNAEARLLTLRKQLRNTTITAPIAGTVTKRSFEHGAVLMPGTQLVEITDISRLKLVINVPEQDVFKYRDGQRITVYSDIYPGTDLTGTVTMVGVKADASRNYTVQILVDNTRKYPLKAGMYGRTAEKNQLKDSVLAVPRVALVGSVKNPQVYVVEGDKAMLKNLQIGTTSGDYVEVLAGLAAGENVVTSGQINLENGTPVQVVQSK